MLAPVGSLNWDESTDNKLVISGRTAQWYYSGEIFRTFTMDEPISHGVLTHFDSKLCVVLTCNDLVYSYSQTGRIGCTGLQFTPEVAVPCENGVVFMFKQKLYLMSDPRSFVGLIVPSSTTSISPEDRLVYFGEKSVSVAVLQNHQQVKLLHTRKVTPRITQKPKRTSSVAFTRRHSSLANQLYHDARIMSGTGEEGILDKLQIGSFNDVQLQKEVVITEITSINFPDAPDLQIVCQRFDNQQAVYLFDKISSQLHELLFTNDSKSPITQQVRMVKGIAKVDGFQIGETSFPFIVLLGDDNKLYLHSSFYHLPDLPLDFDLECTTLRQGCDNSFTVETSAGQLQRLFIITDIRGGLVEKCFEILAHLLEPTATAYWLMVYQSVSQLMPEENNWSVFFMTAIACLCSVEGFDPDSDDTGSWMHVVYHVQTSYPRVSFDHISSMIIICWHLLREEYLLGAHSDDNVDNLALLLSFLTHHAGWEGWTGYYGCLSDLDYLKQAVPKNCAFFLPAEKIYSVVPNIYATLISLIAPPYVEYPQITSLQHIFYRSIVCQSLFKCLSSSEVTVEQMIDLLSRLQLTPEKIGHLSEGVRVPVMEIISALQLQKAIGGGTLEQFKLLGRHDFEATSSTNRELIKREKGDTLPLVRNSKSIDTYMSLLFDNYRGYQETCHLLDYDVIPECGLVQPNDLSDHEWLEIQHSVQWVYVIRTLSLAFGVCAMHYSSESPFISERLSLPDLEFKMLLTETNVQVNFDVNRMPERLMIWSYFHQGISIGLRISEDSENVTGSWIVFNKPLTDNVCLRHAGFLLGLGINGHLKKLEEWHTYNYMGGKDPVISIALLLGLPASYLGTMDSKLTKVLSVHIPALLPHGSNDLNVRSDVRAAAVLGVGLLFFASKNRRMTEVFLSEIYSPNANNDEFYRFSCGLSLGLMNLAKGPELGGDVDSQLVERLEQMATFITDDIRSNPTGPMSCTGATVGLMLMFLQSNNRVVADKLRPPNSKILASYGRPDVLFTRAMAYHLIMWDEIANTTTWVKSMVSDRLYPEDSNLCTEKLPYLNNLGGVVTAMCLRYAGTQDAVALDSALQVIDELIEWTDVPLDDTGVEIANKENRTDLIIALANVNYIISSLVMAASTIVVSSGNTELLKRLEILYNRGLASLPINSVYNLSVGVSQSLGMLFLGGSEYSFDNSPKSIGFLSISVGMLASAGQEVINWQLLRYFWAFAARRSSIILRDVYSNSPLKAVITVSNGTETSIIQAPCLLPYDAKVVEFTHPDYLPISLGLASNHLPAKSFAKTRTVFVQKKTSRPLPDTLEKCFAQDGRDEQDMEATKSISLAVTHLNTMSQSPDQRASYMWNLRLLFTFADFWSRNSDGLKYIPSREIDTFKLNVWRAKQKMTSLH